ncbi:MAG: ferredoxin-type protein NapG [Chromatiaceae bacterium]|nr:ferredoxin-type protein NapG [Gammaproteobacteria bacterium]MCP5318173.1 ferredoxin-type protein NapG [Chromatiaceae bacterium]MCP5435084.1 ferredoxin-type protein NapG [Chromatiaceae bacterium]HPQ25441.1 ferredoxin-type protein NapG [Gammaproteobacteria bacterium]
MSEKDNNSTVPNAARRRFLTDSLRTAVGVGLVAVSLGVYQRQARALPAMAVRPPGAADEKAFQAACIRCGLCVRDCPYDTLKLASLGDEVALGTPYFEARDIPCEMCDDIPCVKACPTGALDPALKEIEKARMGLAVVVDQEACIAFQGLRCEVCFNVCPVRGKAITLNYQHNDRSGKHALFIPVVHSKDCTGCGKCEKACILEEAAIKVFPIALAKGLLGRHYRLGWEQKADAGEALVTPDTPHQYNLPEGMSYEHGGRGLITGERPLPPTPPSRPVAPEAPLPPFSSNPLDTLNRKGGL